MIHAIDLFDVFDGLVGNLPAEAEDPAKSALSPVSTSELTEAFADVATTPRQLTICRLSHEQGGCGVGRATFRTRNVTLRETPTSR